MDNKKKVIIISAIVLAFIILIVLVITLVFKPKDTFKTNNNLSEHQQSMNRISLKAKASGKILKFTVSLGDIQTTEFSVEKSYTEEFNSPIELTNSHNNNQPEDDLTSDLENDVEKCFYRVKAQNNENIVYSNVIAITLKNPSSDSEVQEDIDNNVENIGNGITNNEIASDIYENQGTEIANTSGEDYTIEINLEEEESKSAQNNYLVLNVENTEVEYISLSETEMEFDLSKYKTATLVANIGPSSAKNKTITWTSSNPGVATVEQNGKVTAKSNGSAIITAKTSNGKSENCEIRVTTSPTAISLNKSSINLDMLNRREETLTVNISPSTSSDKTVIWTSSDDNVAIVDSNGLVIAKSNGTATIKAETVNGKSVACQVNITTSGSGVYLNETLVNLDLNETKQVALKATIVPSSAVDKSVTWTSSNNNVAVVDSNGLVTAKSSGNAIITAKTSNGKIATCKVVVEVLATKITLNTTVLNFNLKETKNAKLVATVLPTNTTDKTIKWTSSNPNIATVDSNGNVTAKKTGKATITATCGKISEKCNVTIMYEKGLTQKYDSKSNFYYWIYIPDASAIQDLSQIPLIIFLHGNGETGTNQLYKLKNNKTLVKLLSEDTSFTKYGAIIIAPQSPAYWYNTNLSRLKILVDNVVAEYGICKDKISITGFSGGAISCWDFAVKYPDFISCVVPVAGYRNSYSGEGNLHKKISFWGFVGAWDTASINKMKSLYNDFKSYGGSSQLTIIPNQSHAGTGYVAYKNYDVINWMIKQNKK